MQRPAPKTQGPDPAWLRACMFAHNSFLIGLSTWMFASAVHEALFVQGYSFWGQAFDPREERMARIIHVFYLSKLYEFFDTYIMIVRGNLRQVSFLHVYHHVSISIVWWAIAYSAPGGEAWYSCALNSLVHVLMYSYYLLASIGGANLDFKRRWLWWGKYMTLFQISQFVSMLGQAIYCLFYSPYPKGVSNLYMYYMVTLLALFGNFFAKKHFSGAQKAHGKKAQ